MLTDFYSNVSSYSKQPLFDTVSYKCRDHRNYLVHSACLGLMLVGPTGSGKTKSYESLQIAMTHMKGKINPAGSPFKPVHTYVLNPKSITMGQLYGAFDDLTHEW